MHFNPLVLLLSVALLLALTGWYLRVISTQPREERRRETLTWYLVACAALVGAALSAHAMGVTAKAFGWSLSLFVGGFAMGMAAHRRQQPKPAAI